jgi:hypothetical protein
MIPLIVACKELKIELNYLEIPNKSKPLSACLYTTYFKPKVIRQSVLIADVIAAILAVGGNFCQSYDSTTNVSLNSAYK